jgi:hypothetical protein
MKAHSVLSLLACLLACQAGEPVEIDDRVNAVLGDDSFERAFGEAPGPETDEVLRIRTHLRHVEALLREVDSSDMSEADLEARIENLDRLHDYWVAGRFPDNRPGSARVPRFVDDDAEGALADEAPRLCAVGYLLAQDLGPQAAFDISKYFEHASVFDIRSDVLDRWAASSGLSLDELAMIQPSYRPRPPIIDAEGRLEPEAIRRGLASRQGAVNACVHDRLGARDVHPRRVDAEVTVGPNGSVASAKLSTDLDKEDLGMQRCMAQAVFATQFRAFRGDPVTVKHRFTVIAPTRVDGSLDAAYLPVVFRRAEHNLQQCALASDFDSELLDLTVTASAEPRGRFSDIRVSIHEGPADEGFHGCVARSIRALTLPVFGGEARRASHAYFLTL